MSLTLKMWSQSIKSRIFSTLLILTLCVFNTGHRAFAVDLQQFETDLTNEGALGFIHGASAQLGLFVFTLRNPNDYFDFVEMSMIPGSEVVSRQLLTLQRHDRIRIRGSILPNSSAQIHVIVTSMDIVTEHTTPYPVDEYRPNPNIPDELLAQTEADFLVHAIHAGGRILVVEYKDAVLPVPVQNPSLTQYLYRNDVVRLKYRIQSYPDRPPHLNLEESAAQPVQVLDSIVSRHGQSVSIEGPLILFPQAPGIRFNVFAVGETLPQGLRRQYTIVNFNDPTLFAAVRAKLQAAWDQYPTSYVNGRNKLVSTVVRVRVRGTFNEVDPNQANAQVMVNSVDDIEILP